LSSWLEALSNRTGLLPLERIIAEKNRALRSWSAYDEVFPDRAGGVLTTRQVQPDPLRVHFFAWSLDQAGKVAWVADIGLNAKPASIARGPSGRVIVVGNRGGRLEPTDVDPEPLKGELGIFIATLAL
jgi:hypothetical protein